MKDNARLRQTVEDSMACTAFAEAGEPCPIEDAAQSMEDDTAVEQRVVEQRIDPECALFHENGDQCFL